MVSDDTTEATNDKTGQTLRRRRFLKATGGATVLSATGLAGCIGNGGGSTSVTFGLLTATEEPSATQHEQGAQMLVDEVENSDDYDVEIDLQVKDTGGDPATANQRAQEFISEDGAEILGGTLSSSSALAVNEVALDEEVLWLPTGSADAITGQNCNEYTFRMTQNTSMTDTNLAAYAANNLGSTAWIHYSDYAYGQNSRDRATTAMENAESSVDVLDTTASEQGATNYGSYLSQIADSDAEILWVGSFGSDLLTFLQQASSRGLNEEMAICAPTVSFLPVRQGLGEAAAGMYDAARFNINYEGGNNQEFVSNYRDQFDMTPSFIAWNMYQSLLFAAEAIRESGSSDPAELKDTLPGLRISDTPTGESWHRECDHQGIAPVYLSELVVPDSGSTTQLELLETIDGSDAVRPCEETGCDLA